MNLDVKVKLSNKFCPPQAAFDQWIIQYSLTGTGVRSATETRSPTATASAISSRLR
jgi:hypothetical protein